MCEPRKHTHLILHFISLACIGLLSFALFLCLNYPKSDFCSSSVETPSVTEPPANENSCQDKCGWDCLAFLSFVACNCLCWYQLERWWRRYELLKRIIVPVGQSMFCKIDTFQIFPPNTKFSHFMVCIMSIACSCQLIHQLKGPIFEM